MNVFNLKLAVGGSGENPTETAFSSPEPHWLDYKPHYVSLSWFVTL